ncbi:MAG: hypothetical protein HC929_09820, partial [Leptolyngbyaceae cyanobacterium SM2_5_2]|nr:hypothetical protein [Leptolyngbyaceae cyanobacterium SM2_5_2]
MAPSQARSQIFVGRKELIEVVNGSITIGDRTVLAIPDPHIERWMMVDQRAFKEVFKRGCDALPRIKCKKNEYKELLLKQIRSADIEPIFGGMEYAEDIANSLDLHHCGDSEPSLGDFLKDLRGLLSKLRDDK